MKTNSDDTGGYEEYYKLLQCKSGAVVQGGFFGGMYAMNVGEGPFPPRPEVSLIEFLNDYSFDWEQGNVAVAQKFLDDLKAAHYGNVFARQEYADDNFADGNEREVCACEYYYPRVRRNWPNKPQEVLDREQRIVEIIDDFLEGL